MMTEPLNAQMGGKQVSSGNRRHRPQRPASASVCGIQFKRPSPGLWEEGKLARDQNLADLESQQGISVTKSRGLEQVGT